VTHDGQAVRFYDDLIRGKVVAINMMYADCEGICPLATSNLVRVQELLGARVGRDLFMYSLTLQPDLDTPQRLQAYAAMHGVQAGWWFLTGARADLEHLRYRLGFFDLNPVVDGDKATHTGMVRIGNDGYDRWTSSSALAKPEQIVATINHVDRARGHTGGRPKG
jgi:protein SCO1/2